jgi:hypothetical protein
MQTVCHSFGLEFDDSLSYFNPFHTFFSLYFHYIIQITVEHGQTLCVYDILTGALTEQFGVLLSEVCIVLRHCFLLAE